MRACMNTRISFGRCCPLLIFVITSSRQPGAQVASGQYSQADIATGAKLYAAECASCHGPNGDSINGLDLARNQYRRAASDQDLMKLINAGIPDSGMPGHTFNQAQLTGLVAYLRNMRNAGDAMRLGDVRRGK